MAMSQSSMASTPRNAANTPTDSPYANLWHISSVNTAYDAITLINTTFMTTHDDFMTKLFHISRWLSARYTEIWRNDEKIPLYGEKKLLYIYILI